MALPAEYLVAKAEARKLWESGESTLERFETLLGAASLAVVAQQRQLLEGILIFAPADWYTRKRQK